MKQKIRQIQGVEITSLQDNYIDVLSMDSSEVVHRPILADHVSEKDMILTASPLAEHGFSAFIRILDTPRDRCMLFDFGGSSHGAAFNANLLGVDLREVSELALSHGHMDHFNGMAALTEKIGKKDLLLTVHPAVFREKRHLKIPGGTNLFFPGLRRNDIRSLDLALNESADPSPMLEGRALFLGQIPRNTSFETGMQNAFYEKGDQVIKDGIEDDTALVFHVRDKGLVVLSGCAHSGIINTIDYARKVTGVEKVFAVMGGFHLTGPEFSPKIQPTIRALKSFEPEFVVPCHCTGRQAVMEIEKEMRKQFLLNMSGTRMSFKA